MRLRHTFEVALPPDEAWAVLTDVEQVGPCLPGASITHAAGDEFGGRVAVKVGPISAEYTGEGRFVSRDPSAGRAVLEARGRETRGKGGASAEVTLRLGGSGGGTRVEVETDLSISGRLAQFGRGVITDVADRLLGQFVANLEAQVNGGAGVAPRPPADQAAPSGDPRGAQGSGEGSVVDLATEAWPDDEDLAPADRSDAPAAAPADATREGDLQMLSVVAGPMAKRAAPLVGAALVAWLVWSGCRRRR